MASEQARAGARRDHLAAVVPHVHDAVAGDPVRAHLGALERLAGHRLHGVAPHLDHAHARHAT